MRRDHPTRRLPGVHAAGSGEGDLREEHRPQARPAGHRVTDGEGRRTGALQPGPGRPGRACGSQRSQRPQLPPHRR
ncbi:hypothetical protein BCY76_012290, partial [Nesterenkonia sp. PF2B19]